MGCDMLRQTEGVARRLVGDDVAVDVQVSLGGLEDPCADAVELGEQSDARSVEAIRLRRIAARALNAAGIATADIGYLMGLRRESAKHLLVVRTIACVIADKYDKHHTSKMSLFRSSARSEARQARKAFAAKWQPVAHLGAPGEKPRWSERVLFEAGDGSDTTPGTIWLTSRRIFFLVDPFPQAPSGTFWALEVRSVIRVEVREDDDVSSNYQIVALDGGHEVTYGFAPSRTNESRLSVHILFQAIANEVEHASIYG